MFISNRSEKTHISLNKHVYLGLAILETSETLMHAFCYVYVKPKCGKRIKLCYKDTDSFIIYLNTRNLRNAFEQFYCPKLRGQIAKKWTWEFQKNAKIESPNFWQNYFFLESYAIELIENDDTTRESKYFRNYLWPNFMECQKIVLYMTMPKSSDRLPIFWVD